MARGDYVTKATAARRMAGDAGIIAAFGRTGNVSTAISYLQSQFPQLSKAEAGAAVAAALADLAPRGQRVAASQSQPIGESAHILRPDNIDAFRYRTTVGFVDPNTGETSYLTVYIGSAVPLSREEIAQRAQDKFEQAVEESSDSGISGSEGGPGSEFATVDIRDYERRA